MVRIVLDRIIDQSVMHSQEIMVLEEIFQKQVQSQDILPKLLFLKMTDIRIRVMAK